MRIRLTSPMGWMLGTIFLAVGSILLMIGLFRWDGAEVGAGLIFALCGGGGLGATVRTAAWVELDPEGFSVRKGREQHRILWDELAEVKLKPSGKSFSLEIEWRRNGREKIQTLYLSDGLYQTSHVESTLKWYRNHPDRRFKLKRGAEGNLGPFPSRVYDPTRKRSEVDEAER